jgi:hypothetical protein
MPRLFVSYSRADEAIAKKVERRLVDMGHEVRIPVGAATAGNWRGKLTAALATSDAVVVILGRAGLASRNVLGEIGAARVMEYTSGTLLLPVLIEDLEIPEFISDVYCFRLSTNDDAEVDALAQLLNKAIVDNARSVPRIFISHMHKDQAIAQELTKLLEQAFYIDQHDIRCTSVQPYMLRPGERTSERLRSEIVGAELVMGLLTADITESNYVLCELGASWGCDVPTFPLLARGATFADVPSPLNERHSLSIEKDDNCLQLVDYIANQVSLRRREGVMGTVAQQAKLLSNIAQVPRSSRSHQGAG